MFCNCMKNYRLDSKIKHKCLFMQCHYTCIGLISGGHFILYPPSLKSGGHVPPLSPPVSCTPAGRDSARLEEEVTICY